MESYWSNVKAGSHSISWLSSMFYRFFCGLHWGTITPLTPRKIAGYCGSNYHSSNRRFEHCCPVTMVHAEHSKSLWCLVGFAESSWWYDEWCNTVKSPIFVLIARTRLNGFCSKNLILCLDVMLCGWKINVWIYLIIFHSLAFPVYQPRYLLIFLLYLNMYKLYRYIQKVKKKRSHKSQISF